LRRAFVQIGPAAYQPDHSAQYVIVQLPGAGLDYGQVLTDLAFAPGVHQP
jgi:hypothetical protein